jgi:hypothetical protein
MNEPRDRQCGAALLIVLLAILILVAVGTFILMAVQRNADTRFAFQRSVAGFHAAEAGINVGAAGVLTTMQNFNLPVNCAAQSFPLNGRTVTYTLSVPGRAPGDCTPSTEVATLGSDNPYVGLNAIVHKYTLTSVATNALGFTEASIADKFFAYLIPMFQFAAFYRNDLEVLPAPPAVINGRLHTNGNLYLNSNSCGGAISAGLNVLGRITVVGTSPDPNNSGVFRGRKDSDQNWNDVRISLDGTPSPDQMKVLETSPGSGASCAEVGTRQVSQAEINGFNGRIATHLTQITLPGADTLLCTPWVSGCSGAGGIYWQKADIRMVLDLTDLARLDPVSGIGPALPRIKVLDAAGNLDAGKTDSLRSLLLARPGAITFSDVPNSNQDCSAASCEPTYGAPDGYATLFPQAGDVRCGGPGFPGRRLADGTPSTRVPITAANYCNDYRLGGFYNWREHKPILMLNIDWIALSEWNAGQGGPLFDQNTATNGGLVVFLAVKGPNSSGANNYGVRIFDAARLPRNGSNTGVTFATDAAAYIMGNFNCPAKDTGGGDALPAACGGDKRPASVVADSINVLSCAWIQSQACGQYATGQDQWAGVGVYRPVDERSTTGNGSSNNQAAETVINAAFLAGNDNTWCLANGTGVGCGSAWYSGGLENYPRFHEDWQSGGPYRFWYQGSFVSIDTPRHTCWAVVAKGVANDPAFSCTALPAPRIGFWSDTRYVPPPRRWFYDVSFNDSANLPPLTPRFVYLKLVYFTEVFQ